MKKTIAFAFLALCLAATASAQVNHAELLKRMPAQLLDRAGGAYPDRDGMVGHNRGDFKAAAFQRGATVKLAIAAARGDKQRAADCWRAGRHRTDAAPLSETAVSEEITAWAH